MDLIIRSLKLSGNGARYADVTLDVLALPLVDESWTNPKERSHRLSYEVYVLVKSRVW